jgi:hypothetical protein
MKTLSFSSLDECEQNKLHLPKFRRHLNIEITVVKTTVILQITIFAICRQQPKMFAKTVANMVIFKVREGSRHVTIRKDKAKLSRVQSGI